MVYVTGKGGNGCSARLLTVNIHYAFVLNDGCRFPAVLFPSWWGRKSDCWMLQIHVITHSGLNNR